MLLSASACYSTPSSCYQETTSTRVPVVTRLVHFRTRVGSTAIVRKWRNRGDETPLREEASTSGGSAASPVPPGRLFGFLHIMICCYYLLWCPFTGETRVTPHITRWWHLYRRWWLTEVQHIHDGSGLWKRLQLCFILRRSHLISYL